MSMAQKVLIMGESGTGKSTSLRNCNPETTAVINPVGKPLPFKGSGKFTMLNNVTKSSDITKWMKAQVAAGKKLIVVDDFQYILAVPYMDRIKESGWDKYNDFGDNYFKIIDVCKELPDDVVVAYLTHLETLDNGLTTVKLIGKLLREKITIEGLFTVVLRTLVNEGSYYFVTQNNGKDTVKSPLDMFPAYTIDNDLNYVADKMRNFYEVGDYVSDTAMEAADQAVAGDVQKPEGRRKRGGGDKEKKSHDEVVASNNAKIADYMQKCDEAVAKVAGDREEIPFEEHLDAVASVPEPVLDPVPRRTRKERLSELKEDTYFFIESTGNYVIGRKGNQAPEGGKVITKEEWIEGSARIARGETKNPADQFMNIPDDFQQNMNPPEPSAPARRTRRTRNQ